jgi:hypothetical protein
VIALHNPNLHLIGTKNESSLLFVTYNSGGHPSRLCISHGDEAKEMESGKWGTYFITSWQTLVVVNQS